MGSDGSLTFDTDLDTKGFERGSSKLQNAINSLLKSVDRIGNMDISTPKQIAKFQDQVAKARNEVESMRQKLEDLGSKTISTVEYEELTTSLEKAEKALLKLYDRQELMRSLGVDENSNQWKRLQLQIQDAEEAVKRYENQKSQMEASGSAFASGVDTEQYAQLNAALEEAETKLADYEAAVEQTNEASSGLKAALKGVGGAAVSAAKNLLLLPLNAVTAGFKKVASGIKEYIKNIGKSHSGTKGLLKGLTSLKTMLFSRVKRMFISYIFNEMKEAMNALQQYDKSFGTAMNNMKNSAKELSANLAVSFGGLISAIEPVLTKIINAISTAISYINALFAMLSGKGTVTVAKKQMNDYANAAGGAGKKIEELKRQVYSFDELNKRSKDSDSGGGGGGANAADLFGEVPIDSLLPDSIKDYFERIKAAFEADDWESIGSIIADGLNTGIKAVDDWVIGTLQPKAVIWSEKAALLLNGLIKSTDWGLMGKTIADGLNTVFKSVDTFLSTFDFAATGQAVANLVIGFFSNIDWASIAHGLGKGIQGAFDFLSGFIQTVDWSALPGNILDTFLAIVEAVDWAGITSSFSEFLGSAIGAAFAFGAGIYDSIDQGWSGLIDWWNETAYEDGQFTMEGLLDGILEKIKDIGTWIKTNIFEPFMTGFKNAFGIHSPSTVMAEQGEYIIAGLLNGITGAWDKITEFFGPALDGLKTTLDGAWTSIKSTASTKWGNISDTVSRKWDGIKTFLQNTDWTSVGSNICSGIIDGLNAGWDWLCETVSGLATSLLDSAKRVLGIHSPSRVFRDQIGQNIGFGLAEGIENSERDVNRSVAALAKSTITGFRTDGMSVNVAGSEMISGLDRVASKLAAIADSFRGITAMLDAAGGLIIPGIAAGTVSPPKTRICGYSGSESTVSMGGTTSDLAEYLPLMYRILQDLFDLVKSGRQKGDIDSLVRALSQKQAEISRSYGL